MFKENPGHTNGIVPRPANRLSQAKISPETGGTVQRVVLQLGKANKKQDTQMIITFFFTEIISSSLGKYSN